MGNSLFTSFIIFYLNFYLLVFASSSLYIKGFAVYFLHFIMCTYKFISHALDIDLEILDCDAENSINK